MDEKLNQISTKVEYLEKLFNLNQQNINFNINLTWTILATVVAIIGLALYFLAQMWVSKRVDAEMVKFKNIYTAEMKSIIFNNPQILKFEIKVDPDKNGKVEIDIPGGYNTCRPEIQMYINLWKVESRLYYSDGGTSLVAKVIFNLDFIEYDEDSNKVLCEIVDYKSARRANDYIVHIFLLNNQFKSSPV